MPAKPCIRVTLELDVASETIAGRLVQADAEARPFYGWVQFASAVEAVRDPERRDAAGGRPPTHGGGTT